MYKVKLFWSLCVGKCTQCRERGVKNLAFGNFHFIFSLIFAYDSAPPFVK